MRFSVFLIFFSMKHVCNPPILMIELKQRNLLQLDLTGLRFLATMTILNRLTYQILKGLLYISM